MNYFVTRSPFPYVAIVVFISSKYRLRSLDRPKYNIASDSRAEPRLFPLDVFTVPPRCVCYRCTGEWWKRMKWYRYVGTRTLLVIRVYVYFDDNDGKKRSSFRKGRRDKNRSSHVSLICSFIRFSWERVDPSGRMARVYGTANLNLVVGLFWK